MSLQVSTFAVSNGLAPDAGPRVSYQQFDFGNVESFDYDMFIENSNESMSNVQAVYIDNSRNPNALTLLIKGTNQKIVIKGRSQGTFPVFSGDNLYYTLSTVKDPDAIGSILFLNVPVPFTVWSTV